MTNDMNLILARIDTLVMLLESRATTPEDFIQRVTNAIHQKRRIEEEFWREAARQRAEETAKELEKAI